MTPSLDAPSPPCATVMALSCATMSLPTSFSRVVSRASGSSPRVDVRNAPDMPKCTCITTALSPVPKK